MTDDDWEEIPEDELPDEVKEALSEGLEISSAVMRELAGEGRDHRLDHSTGDTAEGYEPPPLQYREEEVEFWIDPRDNRWGGFVQWVCDYMKALKRKQHDDPEGPIYRHKCVLFEGMQWVDYDIEFDSNEVEHPETKENVTVFKIKVYTALRRRNRTYTDKSFSMSEHDWDELTDML